MCWFPLSLIVMHHEFLPYGDTLNKEYYLEVMYHLRKAIRRKYLGFFASATVLINSLFYVVNLIILSNRFKYNVLRPFFVYIVFLMWLWMNYNKVYFHFRGF